MAIDWAHNSRAIRSKVGALIVKDNQILSDGFNGTPHGADNTCELYITPEGNIPLQQAIMEGYNVGVYKNLVTKPDVIHAEANALYKLATNGGMGCKGATMYCTLEPCLACSIAMIQCGISRVVYAKEYRLHDGVDYLKKHGVVVDFIPIEPVGE